MADKSSFSSDSDDKYITYVSDHHERIVKSMLTECLSETDDYVHILHKSGQPAEPVVKLGVKQGRIIYSTILIMLTHEIMALFVLRKLILQTCMRSHPVGLDV